MGKGKPFGLKIGAVAVCPWDPYHHGSIILHGLVQCAECERPLISLLHEPAAAILENGDVVPTVDAEPPRSNVADETEAA